MGDERAEFEACKSHGTKYVHCCWDCFTAMGHAHAAAIERAKGYRNGQLQVQATCETLMESCDKCAAEVAALRAERDALATRELVEAIAAERDAALQSAAGNASVRDRDRETINSLIAERDALRAACEGARDFIAAIPVEREPFEPMYVAVVRQLRAALAQDAGGKP